MKIICPTLDREETATAENIAEIVKQIENKKNPFAILEKEDQLFMQTLWTPDGYDLEYQEGSVLEHYWLTEFTSQEDAIWALQTYLKGELYWKTKFKFEKKDIATPSFKLGHIVGSFWGEISKIVKGN
jgi:hypothetical protein